ncbi:MAG: type II restriction endonuclease [Zymomonas mobilis subsp. pomaceae]|uniref:Type II site-specific deoxyribonuclease n=1 Tax=Zymomonas mobilis subsp. pomaceae (strain ATCC 29192 / DSM 22645 / JCM 10191 / CCUG 17912 / NBRC 13757 / NCIMB 11200 / NRRL B-4491 / Barker I) TaxID=579138 RepID=F8ET13_ZYMMT|nr:type II restriction endonuclease [Zymomonas mobilis]AEI37917.1 Type II site-specific deoxyribonuclease [Zymomonas mobilis subsp. pomaceae ATCC 29192]MDX5949285.1 type II restriction endonuclease [Zymomonas mobilis subsp. pomaceae]GEB89708.1 hypothetical protein ZMO02_13450 [Zymomonas mobilis subsp. pomaceae]
MNIIKSTLISEISKLSNAYAVCGIVDRSGCIYPLGADTKVLSTIFELVSRPAVYAAAKSLGYECVEPNVQNHYPDFTFHRGEDQPEKIAIDVKTTYRIHDKDKFSYTLGGYTSFIREGNEKKNIVYPFSDYSEHWIIGFVYNRIASKKSLAEHKFSVQDLEKIPLPFGNVEFFVQEKWKIASDRAGSGNTTNIGSINGNIDDFWHGRGPFTSEDEFLKYWRQYGRTKKEREDYSNLTQFRSFNQRLF